MKTQEFTSIYKTIIETNTNIINDEAFNQEGWFWLQLTTKQHIKMYKLMLKQGAKEHNENGRKYIELVNGIQINRLY